MGLVHRLYTVWNIEKTKSTININIEGYIIDRVAELKQKLSNGVLNKGWANFGYMEVDIPNIKTKFYAHSQVNGPPLAHQPNIK